jgi:hypothetical protein
MPADIGIGGLKLERSTCYPELKLHTVVRLTVFPLPKHAQRISAANRRDATSERSPLGEESEMESAHSEDQRNVGSR